MGTDIHIWLEKNVDGKWLYVEPAKGDLGRNKYRDEYEAGNPKEPYHGKGSSVPHDWDMSRNYNAFAILADVRNGRGFAGVKTGEGFKPILPASGPGINPEIPHTRGWPKDCSKELKKVQVDHTPTWLLLSEIVNFDWKQTTLCCGVISLAQYVEWREKKGAPESWSGAITGRMVKTVSQAEADELLKQHTYKSLTEGTIEHHVSVDWEQTYAEATYDFYSEHLPALIQLAAREGVTCDKLRLVFYFDS